MNFHHPDTAAGGKAVLLTGPFGEPERTIALERPMTVAEVIAENDLGFRLPTIAVMDGEPVLRECWNLRVVRPGEVLAFVAVPRGGGVGDNTGKQIAGLIAALALSVAAPFLGAALFGAGTIGAAVFSAALLAGGSLLLNALFQPPQPPAETRENVYSVTAARNQAAPLDVIPVLYGRLRYPPRFAARPYSEYAGNEQFLYQLFAVTAGTAAIEKIDIGETEAWNSTDGYSASFSDLEFEIAQPGEDVTLFPANVVTSAEVAGQAVPDPADVLGPFVLNSAGTSIDRIAVDFAFPGGLWTANERAVASNSIALRAQYRKIDDAGDAIGAWTSIFAETISAATRTPQRMTRSAAVAPGRYEVRFLADEAFDPDDGTAVNGCIWSGLRGYLTGFVTPPGCTLLAMKIRASEQLSQFSASQIRVTAIRHLPVWDGEDWTAPEATRSIAWAAADMLTNSDYSIGLTEPQFDLAALSALDATWTGRGDTFNALFDRSWTLQEALRAVLRAGRAQPVRLGGRISFTRLEPKAIKRATFTPRNVVRGTFQHRLVMFDEEKPDSVTGSFIDGTTWQQREVVASLASIGSEQPQKIEWFGITDHDQAWRESVTEAAVNAYQREFVGFTADWEGKLLVRGDPILVMHPFIEGVETAALVSRAGPVLTIDRDLVQAIAGDAYVILRDKTGREWGPCLVATIDDREITLDVADLGSVETAMGSLSDLLPGARSERAHVLICDGETRPFDGLLVSAVPNASGKVEVLAVLDAPEVYLTDGVETMPSPWSPPTLPPAVPLRPSLLGLYATLQPAVAGLELDAMWLPAPGATGGYVAEVSYDGEETWTPVYAGAANRFTVPVLPQVLTVRVAAVGNLQGPWSIREFIAGEMPDIRLTGVYLADAAVKIANLAQELQNIAGPIVGDIYARIASFDEQLGDLAQVVMDNSETALRKVSGLSLRNASAAAAVLRVEEVITGPGSAFAQLTEQVAAMYDDLSANGLVKLEAFVDPDTAEVTVSFKARAQAGDTFGEAVLQLGAASDGAGATSESWIAMMADRLWFLSTDAAYVSQPFKVESINAVPSVVVTTLYFDNLFSSAEASPGAPIISQIGADGTFSFGT